MTHRLPAARALIARRLFISGIEAVEDGEHDQQPERQGPGQVRAERGTVPRALDPQHLEQRADPEADDDRWHHQARDGEVKERRRAPEAPAKGQPGEKREQHRADHHDQTEAERAVKRAPDVTDRLWLEQLPEPVQRHSVHREHEPALGALERQEHDRHDRAVKEQDEQAEQQRQRPKDRRPTHAHSSLRMSTARIKSAIITMTAASRTIALGAAGGNCRYESWVAICLPTEAICPPPSTSTVTKSPITIAMTKIEPIAIPVFDKGRTTLVITCQVVAPASTAASISERSIRTIELKIGTIIVKV